MTKNLYIQIVIALRSKSIIFQKRRVHTMLKRRNYLQEFSFSLINAQIVVNGQNLRESRMSTRLPDILGAAHSLKEIKNILQVLGVRLQAPRTLTTKCRD